MKVWTEAEKKYACIDLIIRYKQAGVLIRSKDLSVKLHKLSTREYNALLKIIIKYGRTKPVKKDGKKV